MNHKKNPCQRVPAGRKGLSGKLMQYAIMQYTPPLSANNPALRCDKGGLLAMENKTKIIKENAKIFAEKFGESRKNSYLCSVIIKRDSGHPV